jgi:hypothetical protein
MNETQFNIIRLILNGIDTNEQLTAVGVDTYEVKLMVFKKWLSRNDDLSIYVTASGQRKYNIKKAPKIKTSIAEPRSPIDWDKPFNAPKPHAIHLERMEKERKYKSLLLSKD